MDQTSEDEVESEITRDDKWPELDRPENLDDDENTNAPAPSSPPLETDIIPNEPSQRQSLEVIVPKKPTTVISIDFPMSNMAPSDDNPSGSTKRPSMSKNNPPPPTKLPMWLWSKESCSLDASLTILMLLMDTLPRYIAAHEAKGSLALQTFYRQYKEWITTPWTERSIVVMTKARDVVRNVFLQSKPPLRINVKCSVEQTFVHLIPRPLRAMLVQGMFSCSNPACVQRGDQPVWQPKGLTSHVVKDYSLDTISFDAKQQKDSSMQKLLNDLVYILYSLLITFPQPTLFHYTTHSPPACKVCRKRTKVRLSDIRIVTAPPVLVLHPVFGNEDIYNESPQNITYPFVLDLNVTFAKKEYTYVASVMAWPKYFWTIVNINREIYLGETAIPDPHLRYHGPGPYITQKKLDSAFVQPDYHIYRLSEDLEDPMTNIVTSRTKQGPESQTEQDTEMNMEM